jgi:hypothetical protein
LQCRSVIPKKSECMPIAVKDVELWLDRLYIAADGAGLRNEDKKKAREVAAILSEVEREAGRLSKKSPLILVDAAAGKSYVGLLSAKLIFEPAGRQAAIVAIEKDPSRTEAGRKALALLDTRIPVECRTADVGTDAAWPERVSIVTALHACGSAADTIIDRTISVGGRVLLAAPCCTSRAVAASARAVARAEEFGIPRHAPVRRRFIQAMVDAERTWRLEAAGYETEVVEFVAPSVTPHNLLWRARLVREPRRSEVARHALKRMRGYVK